MIPAPVRKRPSRAPLPPAAELSVVLLIALGLCPSLSAQTPATGAAARVSGLVDALSQVKTPVTAAISPDGTLVAWAYKGAHGSELHLTPTAPARQPDRVLSPDTIREPARTQPGQCTAGHPTWSSNGTRLAFLSNCSDEAGKTTPTKQENIWVWTAASNTVKQVTHLHGFLSSLEWSPDGKSIGFLFVENATREAGALAAMKPPSGVIGEDGVEIQQIQVVNLADRAISNPLPGPLVHSFHVYEFSWSPDSRNLVFVAAPPPGENTWWIAKLYTQPYPAQDCRGFCGPFKILDPSSTAGPLHGLQIAVPRFSPDGKQIAFIGGLMSDQGSTGGDIYLVPTHAPGATAPDQPRNLTPGTKGSPAWLAWTGPETIEFTEHLGGVMHIAFLNTATGTVDPQNAFDLPGTISADSLASSLSLSKRGEAFILSSYTQPPEVWAGINSAPHPITHLNDALKPAWGKAESIEWTNDGFHIQGWLLYPADYNPARQYPFIVSVHGGPSSAVTPRWPEAAYGAVPFSALGYFVFLPNPRRSYGQGERFTQANVKDFGYGDLRDVLAGMDVVEKRLPIDPNREGLTGWSYGGFMTMFAVTQTTRFHAAVAGAGIANWLSYYGENSIDQWMVPFFGATVYDDPAIYAKSSAIDFIKKVKTPTLVVVGDRDGECPAPQSFEFWHALRAEGVPTQLVVYPNEGHHFVDPSHKKDVLRRALEWFESQMPETQGSRNAQ